MYGEQNKTRLYRVDIVATFDTVLSGANTSDHVRHIYCNGTRQYQPKGNYYICHGIPSFSIPWWRHDIETLSLLLTLCTENHCSLVYSPHEGPWMGSFEVSIVDRVKNHENKQLVVRVAWWRHQMVDFPSQRPMTRSVVVFFGLRLNKRLSKQSRRQWFQMPSRSLWHHSDGPWYQAPWRTCSGTVLRSHLSYHDPRHMFCLRTLFLIYSVQCVTLPFLFTKSVPKSFQCVSV